MVSTVKTANNEGDILTAKTKAVGECVGAFSLPCLIGNVVQIAVGVGLFVIDRGWEPAIANGQQTNDQFGGSSRCNEMPHHALCAGNGDLIGPWSKHFFDGDGFHAIVDARACAVRVDVADLLKANARVLNG